jgi:hypothetical protein
MDDEPAPHTYAPTADESDSTDPTCVLQSSLWPTLTIDDLPDVVLLSIFHALADYLLAAQREVERSFFVAEAWRPLLLVCRRFRIVAKSPRLRVWWVLDQEGYEHLGGDTPGSFNESGLRRVPPFRCAVLRSLDLANIQSEDDADISARTLSLLLKRSKETLVALRLPPRMSVILADVAVGLVPSLRQLRSLSFARNENVSGELLRRLPAGSLPNLRRLNLAMCGGNGLWASWGQLLEAAPMLEALNAGTIEGKGGDPGAIRLLRAGVRGDLADPPATAHYPRELRAVLGWCWGGAAPLPLDVECGVCGQKIWRGLRSYIVARGSQPHIETELYTDVPPTELSAALVAFAPGDAGDQQPVEDICTSRVARYNCLKNCHGLRGLWLVDRESGVISTHGHKWAIACGPASDRHPELGKLRAVTVSTEWVGREFCWPSS